MSGHAREHFRDAFELSDGKIELTADTRVRAGCEYGGLRAARRARGQRDAAADRQLLDEHAPALARHLRATDDGIERYEHILTLNRSVLERHVQRKMSTPDRDARCVARNERARDAVLHAGALEQAIGIV